MAELKTTRPFQERFLDGFDRSQLRQEVQKVKPKKFSGWRKRYATWALGASLALGGIGAPMKMIHDSQEALTGRGPQATSSAGGSSAADSLGNAITNDLKTARSIADQVAGGVAAAAHGVQAAAKSPLRAVGESTKQLTMLTDGVKEQFFKTQVPFGSIIYKEATKNNLRPELVAAVIQQESRFKPTARSHMGAQGLMQMVPKTGRWMGANNLMDPTQNITAGAKYLRYLHDQFDGNETKVIAAYNAGEGNVRRFGGVPPFKETRNYVQKVRSYQQEFAQRVQNHIADASTVPDVTR